MTPIFRLRGVSKEMLFFFFLLHERESGPSNQLEGSPISHLTARCRSDQYQKEDGNIAHE